MSGRDDNTQRRPADDESIAAFLDGRLDEARRADVAAALAEDEEGRYLLAETAACIEPPRRGARLLGWWSTAPRAGQLLVAAALVVAAVVVVGPGSRFIRDSNPPPSPLDALERAAADRALVVPAAFSPRAFLGAEGAQQLAARAAVAAADVAATSGSGDADPAALATLRELGDRLELEAATESWLAGRQDEPQSEPPPRRALDDLAAATDARVFEAALWLEVLRIAAHNRLDGLFGTRELDDAREAIASIEWGPQADRATRLDELSRSADLDREGFAAIEAASAELLARLQAGAVS